jgi:hypothetical protein
MDVLIKTENRKIYARVLFVAMGDFAGAKIRDPMQGSIRTYVAGSEGPW